VSRTISIRAPHVPYGPEHLADAQYIGSAAQHIEDGYKVGGSNLTATVVSLLREVQRALLVEPIDPEATFELTYAERVALPPAYHQPFFDGLGVPHSWLCAVCWDDDLVTSWPCEPATAGGVELAAHLGLKAHR
jgi:hypothetical protein